MRGSSLCAGKEGRVGQPSSFVVVIMPFAFIITSWVVQGSVFDLRVSFSAGLLKHWGDDVRREVSARE